MGEKRAAKQGRAVCLGGAMVIWKSAPLGERERARWPGFLDLFLLPPGLLEAMQREPTRRTGGASLGGLAAGACPSLGLELELEQTETPRQKFAHEGEGKGGRRHSSSSYCVAASLGAHYTCLGIRHGLKLLLFRWGTEAQRGT